MMRSTPMILLALAIMGCAGAPKQARPPAASFEGTLSEQVLPASIIGPDWNMKQGLMVDDLANPPEIPLNRKRWADAFLKQRRAAGARSYGEIFYYSPEDPPLKVSTLVLVYQDSRSAQRHWNETYGPGLLTPVYARTNDIGDKSVRHKKFDEVVVLAGNVILQVSQPVAGTANDTVLQAYMETLGVNRPAGSAQTP